MIKSLIHQKLNQLTTTKTIWIAYSGGLDSHTLLHILSDYPANIRAIHIHHGLHPKANDWAEHCLKICSTLNIPLHIEKIQLERPDKNIEAAAREKRYAVFSKLLGKNEVLLTAQHQDDQIETFLLQLFRGAGLKGLSSMPEKISFAKGHLIRPLLHLSQLELKQYAKTLNLQWVEDDSNQQLRFHRNFLRHQVLPLIQTRWQALPNIINRTASHLAEAQSLLDILAEQDLKDLLREHQTLSISKLLTFSSTRQKNVLRYWLNQLYLPLPSDQKLRSIQNTLLNCKKDRMPLVTWKGVEIRRYRDQLYALTPQPIKTKIEVYEWDISKTIQVEGRTFSKENLIEKGIDLSGVEKLTIRFRQGGERLQLKGQKHTKSLKKLFQEWKIPPWERERVLLIYKENCLIGVLL